MSLFVFITILTAGASYAWFSAIIEGTGKPISVTVGILNVKYTDTELINLTGSSVGMPIYDSQKDEKAYKNIFSISHDTNGTVEACYSMELVIDSIQDKFKSKHLKWELYNSSTNESVATGDFSESTTGSSITLKKGIQLPRNEVHNYELRVWLSYSETEDQSELLLNNSGEALSAHIKVSSYSGTCIINNKLYQQILADNPNVSERTTFNTTFTASNNGNTIYKASGQGGEDTYYFAGAVTNNYVKFGTNTSGQQLYWRIVRINEDNSVRLIYAGTSATDTSAFIKNVNQFNTISNNSAYAGYMYQISGVASDTGVSQTETIQHGLATSSDVKKELDTWYRNNLESAYDKYISKTAIYCNDRTVGSGSWSATGSTFDYSAFIRLDTNYYPSYACTEPNDQFTASSNVGNGALSKPIGLITADEVSYAGGLYGLNNEEFYISENASEGVSYWWTMTPAYWDEAFAYESYVGSSLASGFLLNDIVEAKGGVRPVISLKSCVEWSKGTGIVGDEYEVTVSDACAALEN